MNVGDIVELEGWLVIVDYKLVLMPENYSESYEGGEKVEISNPEIMFSVKRISASSRAKPFNGSVSKLIVRQYPLQSIDISMKI